MMEETAGQDFLLITIKNIIYFEHTLYPYSNPAEYHYFLWTLLYSYSCGSQVNAQPSSGHIIHARSCVRGDYPSEVVEMVSYCTKSSRMSRKLVSGNTVPFHHQVMSDDIDDIQHPRYYRRRRIFFNMYVGLYGPGWLYVLRMPPRGDFRLWTPRARATDLGQGPHLRRGVRAGSLCAPEPRAREKTRGRKRKSAESRCAKKHIYT